MEWAISMEESQYLDRSEMRFRWISGNSEWKEETICVWEAWTVSEMG